VHRQARQIIRIERLLVIFSLVFAAVLLGASLYFERTLDIGPYSLAFAAGFFAISLICFTILFRLFGDSFRDRRKKGTRTLFMLASLYVVIAAVAAYVVAFGLYGLKTPWAGEGRDHLYACYFLLSVAAVFLARSGVFYWRLRSYISHSLGNLNK
jgi:O-antigen/teichoic acid export membrane protein